MAEGNHSKFQRFEFLSSIILHKVFLFWKYYNVNNFSREKKFASDLLFCINMWLSYGNSDDSGNSNSHQLNPSQGLHNELFSTHHTVVTRHPICILLLIFIIHNSCDLNTLSGNGQKWHMQFKLGIIMSSVMKSCLPSCLVLLEKQITAFPIKSMQ